jgi:hypothetical protein
VEHILFVLQRWDPAQSFDSLDFSKVPTWMLLFKIPFHPFHRTGVILLVLLVGL